MSFKPLKQGDRIRLKVRSLSGWRGNGTVLADCVGNGDAVVQFAADGASGSAPSIAIRREVALLQKQVQEAQP